VGAAVALPWWLGAAFSTLARGPENFSVCLLEEMKYLMHFWAFFFFFLKAVCVDEIPWERHYLSKHTFFIRKTVEQL